MRTKILGLLAVGLLAGPMAANAALLFDNTIYTTNISFFGVYGRVNEISVAQSTAINQIGAFIKPCDFQTTCTANLNFVVFNYVSGELLFSTGPQQFADIGIGWYTSSQFADFVLAPGITYGIGYVADVLAAVPVNLNYDPSPVTQNGISSPYASRQVDNFLAPSLGVALNTSPTFLALYGYIPTAVPEPGTLALLGLGLAGLGLSRRRKAN